MKNKNQGFCASCGAIGDFDYCPEHPNCHYERNPLDLPFNKLKCIECGLEGWDIGPMVEGHCAGCVAEQVWDLQHSKEMNHINYGGGN
jgi:hypothetical protein